MKKMGILHESVYTFFRHFGCIEVSGFRCQCSGVRKEKRKNCAVLKANAANLTPDT